MLVATGTFPGFIIVDRLGLPRLWGTAWACGLSGPRRSDNTLKLQLRHLDRFYQFSDSRNGYGSLDDAISRNEPDALFELLEGMHLELGADEVNTTAVQCWDVVRRFVLSFALRRAGESEGWSHLGAYINGLGRLRPTTLGKISFARSLPATTLTDLLSVATPDSKRNPFNNESVKWRNWLLLNLFLLCGIRRGEALLLNAASLGSDLDSTTGAVISWIDVTNIDDDEDPRSTRPSIKTAASHRQIPVSSSLAKLWEHYVANHRPAADHGFLFVSRDGLPLSVESVSKALAKLSSALLERSLELFRKRSGGKAKISAHDLRHTCATVRYATFLKRGDDRELALQRMRAFFGWSIGSKMPDLYARSAIHDDLLKSWASSFDEKLVSLGGKS